MFGMYHLYVVHETVEPWYPSPPDPPAVFETIPTPSLDAQIAQFVIDTRMQNIAHSPPAHVLYGS